MDFSYLRFTIGAALLVVACSAQQSPVVENDAQERVVGPMRRTPEEAKQLEDKARHGDVGAMHFLAAHHITAGETAQSRYWLGEAVRHGDCHAVQLLIGNGYFKVPPEELEHWRREERILGCDPKKNYIDQIGKRRRDMPGQ